MEMTRVRDDSGNVYIHDAKYSLTPHPANKPHQNDARAILFSVFFRYFGILVDN